MAPLKVWEMQGITDITALIWAKATPNMETYKSENMIIHACSNYFE